MLNISVLAMVRYFKDSLEDGIIWLKIGKINSLLWAWKWTFRLLAIYCLVEKLLDSEEGHLLWKWCIYSLIYLFIHLFIHSSIYLFTYGLFLIPFCFLCRFVQESVFLFTYIDRNISKYKMSVKYFLGKWQDICYARSFLSTIHNLLNQTQN